MLYTILLMCALCPQIETKCYLDTGSVEARATIREKNYVVHTYLYYDKNNCDCYISYAGEKGVKYYQLILE